MLLFCYGYTMLLIDQADTYPISYSVASLALGQLYDCPSANEVFWIDMGKLAHTKPQHNTTKDGTCA